VKRYAGDDRLRRRDREEERPAFAKAAHSQLVAVMRRNGALAADYARRHGVARWHDDADAIIGAPDIDAVYIATLTDSHREYTLRCAAAGKPVYVEKPMGMNHAECLDMIAACRRRACPLWVGYYRRALPRFLAVRDLVAAGASARCAWCCRASSSGCRRRAFARAACRGASNRAVGRRVLLRVVCHTFDFLDFLFGPISDVRGVRRQQAAALPRRGCRRGHATGSLRACTARRVVLRGRLRRGVQRDHRRDGTHPVLDVRAVPIRYCAATRRGIADRRSRARHQPLIQTIVDELNGNGKCPSTGESGARTAQRDGRDPRGIPRCRKRTCPPPIAGRQGGPLEELDCLPAADEGHLRRHDRHELDVGVERQARHVDHGARDVRDVHQRLDRDLAVGLRHASAPCARPTRCARCRYRSGRTRCRTCGRRATSTW
jgi:hypothetical protein